MLIVHYIDVDQADAMLLIAGDTKILIDGGNTGTAGEVLKVGHHGSYSSTSQVFFGQGRPVIPN